MKLGSLSKPLWVTLIGLLVIVMVFVRSRPSASGRARRERATA